MKKTNIALLAAALLGLGLASCDDDKQLTLDGKETKLLDEITFTNMEGTLPLAIGMDSTITWTVGPEDASDKTVIFASDNEAVATVDQNGKITAISEGTAIVTGVSSLGFAVFDASATVVVNVIPEVTKATSLTITNTTPAGEDGLIYVSDELQMAAEILPADVTYTKLEWRSLNADVASVDQKGLVKCLAQGDAVIQAITTDRSGVYAEFKFHVNRMVDAERVEIAPVEPLVINQGSVELGVTYFPADATVGSVEWTSDNEMVATVRRGVVTPVGFGTANITATCPATGESTTVAVTVEDGLYVWDARNQWQRWICSGADGGEVRDGDSWRINFPATTGKYRRDIKIDCSNTNLFTMTSTRPVLAIKCNIPKGGNNTWDVRDSGNPKDNNGYDLPDGNRLIMIDLTKKFQEWGAKEHGFNLFQLKVADIPNGNVDAADPHYNVFWIRTFTSADEAKAFADEDARK